MSNKVFKRDQVCLGSPFRVGIPIYYNDDNPEEKYKVSELKESYYSANLNRTYNDLLENARKQAESIINDAQCEASAIIDDAVEESKIKAFKIEEDARRKGYEKGFQEGLEEGRKKYRNLILELQKERQCARDDYKRVVKNIEADAVYLVLEISKKIIGEEISVRKELILELIRQGFEKSMYKDSLVLKVSPEDYQFVTENKNALCAAVPGMGELEIRSDPNLHSASCIIETPQGTVDAGLETRFSRIEELFKKILAVEK
ncbi:MAG TPA: flagellar biosynthesis protein [Clostridiaceae bacterium]|nr:flagellar biosynthesis protein [Clostridiaceae bacterium]